MKITNNNYNTIFLALVVAFAKLDCVKGGGGGGGTSDLFAAAWTACPFHESGCLFDMLFNRRLVAKNEDPFFLTQGETNICLDETVYETKLYFQSGHFFLLASPESQDSDCHIVAIDHGYIDENEEILAPHVSLLEIEPEGGLSLGHSITLGSLSKAMSDMDPSLHTIPKNEYNLLKNNCGSFLMAVADQIGLDYKEPKTYHEIVNYLSKIIAEDQSTLAAIRKAYYEENTGVFQQTQFDIWNFLVGDEGMVNAFVTTYLG
jgi:hypothetical protein